MGVRWGCVRGFGLVRLVKNDLVSELPCSSGFSPLLRLGLMGLDWIVVMEGCV